METKKSTGKKPELVKKKKISPAKEKLGQDAVRNEIIVWVTLAVSVFLLLGNFGLCGKIGDALTGALFGCFGCLQYIVPFLLFAGISFGYMNRENKIAVIRVLAGVLFFFFFSGFLQVFAKNQMELNFLEVYKYSREHHAYGGCMGYLLLKLLQPFGVGGSVVILLLLLVVCFVLMTGYSLLELFEHNGRKAYDAVRESSKEYRENRPKRQAEQKAKREQRQKKREEIQKKRKKIRAERERGAGISYDTDLLKDHLPMEEIERQEAEALEREEAEGLYRLYADEEAEWEEAASGYPNDSWERAEAGYSNDSRERAEAGYSNGSRERAEAGYSDNRPGGAITSRPDNRQSRESDASESAGIHRSTSVSEPGIQEKEGYIFPPFDLLKQGQGKTQGDSELHLQETAMKLKKTLETFGVRVTVSAVTCGPSVTRYEIQPEMGVKVSRILGLADDIQLNLAAKDIRIEAPIPGKAAIGIEIPNQKNVPVLVRDLLESKEFQNHKSNLAFAVGKDIAGKIIVSDIAKMPHLLIAGATGSGKSVCINVLIMGILYKAHPEDVKMIMIDPKVVELSVYNGIPHLMVPVVTDPQKAAAALNWGVAQMDERYRLFSEYGAKNLVSYNKKIEQLGDDIPIEQRPKKLPQILIIVDELADLMMVAKGDVEKAICRLTQLARAAGIHLIIATQRPSVDVITGLIKANMPSRIAFSVSSNVDSRTILDSNGAEKLLGKGDMLFFPQGYQHPDRLQGAFVSEQEVSDVVQYILDSHGKAVYDEEIEGHLNMEAASIGSSSGGASGAEPMDDRDEYFEDAARFVVEKENATIGMLQRVFRIGFNRAARLMDQLAEAGIVGEAEGTKPRKVMMTMEELEQSLEGKNEV